MHLCIKKCTRPVIYFVGLCTVPNCFQQCFNQRRRFDLNICGDFFSYSLYHQFSCQVVQVHAHIDTNHYKPNTPLLQPNIPIFKLIYCNMLWAWTFNHWKTESPYKAYFARLLTFSTIFNMTLVTTCPCGPTLNLCKGFEPRDILKAQCVFSDNLIVVTRSTSAT